MVPLLQKIYSRQIFPTKNAKSELSRCIRYSSSSYSTPCMLENLPSKYIWCSDCSDLRSFPLFLRKTILWFMIFPPCLISTINSRHSSKPSRRKAKISDGSKQRHLLHHARSSKVKNGRFPASKEDVHKKRRIATVRWYKISGEILFKSHVFNLNLPPSLQLSATYLTFGTNDRAANPSQFCWVPMFAK